jgi:hypothetical protein
MGQNIPHACNLRPRDMGLFCIEQINALIFEGLSDNLKIPNDGILGLAILKKGVKRLT